MDDFSSRLLRQVECTGENNTDKLNTFYLHSGQQPALLLLLFITLKEDPWRVFTVPRFPLGSACFHAPLAKRAGAFVVGGELLRVDCPSSAQFECTQQDLDGPQSQGLSSQEAE
ncbi:hypothetical protein EYF80_001551 [Liparis tanakae]|uniref:Uncharacterized protein n=1 Tax=Liparis tanakae TaxID=230148 RepID=A0A4Z2JDI1_9TELE|nr:hypothetical protein EYF80_001551 [Liparis tanakae]